MDSGAPTPVREAFAAAMAEAGVELTMSVYDGVYHSFTNPDADSYGKPDYARYDAAARAKAWDEMLALFGRTMG
jgi:dienelactone hydrolase